MPTTTPMPDLFAALLADPPIRTLMTLLNGDGAETRIVGGAVRNTLLGLPTTDIDLATNLLPEDVTARARAARLKVVPTGLVHGTVTVIVQHRPFEVTTLRRDVETDGRHAVVAFSTSFEEDALRRDFTINQLSLSADGAVHDHAGGLQDLAARKVRFIGEAAQRIAEDYLRIMRFFRFHAEYGEGALDAGGLSACLALKHGMAQLSAERIRSELIKLLAARQAGLVVPAFVEGGFWQAVAGDMAADLPAFSAALAALPECDALARLGALAVRRGEDADALQARLRLSNREAARLAGLGAVLAEWGDGAGPDARALKLAAVRHGPAAARDGLAARAAKLGVERTRGLAGVALPSGPFRGADVLALGVPPGPHVGDILAKALQLWADRDFPEDEAARATCLAEAAAG